LSAEHTWLRHASRTIAMRLRDAGMTAGLVGVGRERFILYNMACR
jgi:hypothetical protein